MAATIQRTEVETLAELLTGQLAAIETGDLDAPSALRERLVGAVTALRVVLGDDPDDVLDRLSRDQV
jgi:hypothetical protein